MTESKDGKDNSQAKKGGFGAFADKYRERWEANHPSAQPAKPGAAKAPEPAPAADGDAGPKEL
jgi:hypothetical protein